MPEENRITGRRGYGLSGRFFNLDGKWPESVRTGGILPGLSADKTVGIAQFGQGEQEETEERRTGKWQE